MWAALDCSKHGGQQHSLFDWLPVSHCMHLVLIHSPSHLKWGPQGEAHDYIHSLPHIVVGQRPTTTLTWLRDFADCKALDLWNARFQDISYRGRHFLPLRDLQDC